MKYWSLHWSWSNNLGFLPSGPLFLFFLLKYKRAGSKEMVWNLWVVTKQVTWLEETKMLLLDHQMMINDMASSTLRIEDKKLLHKPFLLVGSYLIYHLWEFLVLSFYIWNLKFEIKGSWKWKKGPKEIGQKYYLDSL